MLKPMLCHALKQGLKFKYGKFPFVETHFDSWFEKFSTWEDFRQSLENMGLDEFGVSAE